MGILSVSLHFLKTEDLGLQVPKYFALLTIRRPS